MSEFPPPPPKGSRERPPLVTQLRFPFRLFSRILSLPEEREKNSPLPLPPLLPSFRARISFIRFERSRSPREEAGFEERKEREDCQPNELDFFSPFVPSRVSLPPPSSQTHRLPRRSFFFVENKPLSTMTKHGW